MPNPEGSDLHIDQALTGVSVAYFQEESVFIADKVFPSYPVDKRSDMFRKHSKSDWRRTDAEKRAPGTESAGIGWTTTLDNYYAEVYAAHVDINDQDRANADDDWDLDSDATRLVTQHLLIQKDQIWANSFFGTGIWDTEKVGGTDFDPWDDAGSDPLANSSSFLTAGRLLTSKKFNIAVMGADVWVAVQNHPAILDRIKYTQKGVVTEDLVAEFFGVEKMLIGYSSDAEGPKIPDAKAQDAAATYDWILDPKSLLFAYAPPRPGKLTPAAGYTFNWKGYGAGNKYGLTMGNLRAPLIKSDRIEGEAAYVMKQVSADCGIFLSDVVS